MAGAHHSACNWPYLGLLFSTFIQIFVLLWLLLGGVLFMTVAVGAKVTTIKDSACMARGMGWKSHSPLNFSFPLSLLWPFSENYDSMSHILSHFDGDAFQCQFLKKCGHFCQILLEVTYLSCLYPIQQWGYRNIIAFWWLQIRDTLKKMLNL